MANPTQQRPRYRHASKRAPGWANTQHVYRPRRPTTTPLYPVVQHHLETFLAEAAQSHPRGYGFPSWVVMELLHAFNERSGTSFLIVTHEQGMADDCRRIVHMVDGAIAWDRAVGGASVSPAAPS
jgi:hypothetical protein